MSLYVASLNSGSNGNCYYLGNEQEAVLIDAGISCREIEKRLKRLELSVDKIKAVFISHEHGDHIHGVAALSKKFKIPVYITEATYRAGNLVVDSSLLHSFVPHQKVIIGALEVKAFPKKHDAIDPYSFTITHKEVTAGVFTDIGRCCENVISYFKQCHAVFLEANYDREMLESGGYPVALKNRIRNGWGHLSNDEAAQLVDKHRPPQLTHVFLSHLSRNNNSPERALEAFERVRSGIHVSIAPREREAAVFHIQEGEIIPASLLNSGVRKNVDVQLSLF